MRILRHPLLWMLVLALAYIALAAINRHYAWSWGREWLSPLMLTAVLTGPVLYPLWAPPRRCCRTPQ